MAWQTFATKTSPVAMSTLDTQFANAAQWSLVDCTATGTNVITLTPSLSGYTAPAYANYVSYRFVAAATTSGSLTLKVGSLAALNVYNADGITQVTTGGVVSAQAYMATYNSALNSSAGGWYLTSLGITPQTNAVSSVFARTGAVVATANDYTEAQISFSDIATNNVSITKHGYAPKAPNDATKFLDGTGAFSTPGGTVTAGSGISVSGSTVSINTNNAIGIGAYAIFYSSLAVGSGATTAGSGLTYAFGNASTAGTWESSGTGSGTWRNVSGVTLNSASGLFIRTA